MNTRNLWVRNLRFKLFAVLCAVLLGQGFFVRPAFAALANERDSQISVISRGPGKLDIFVERSGAIKMKSWTGSTWTGWTNFGKPPVGGNFITVSAVAAGNNRWDIFATADTFENQHVWHLAFDGVYLWTWESMGNIGGANDGGVQAVSTGNGRIDLFTRTTATSVSTGPVLWKSWTASGGWKPSQTGWTTLDNTQSPMTFTALAHSGNRLDLFRRLDSNQVIGRRFFDGTFWAPFQTFNPYGWQGMGGGQTKKTPYAVSWGTNRIDVFVRGTDDYIYINNTNDAGANWSGWGYLGRGNTSASYGSAPSAVAWGSNRLDIFIEDDGDLYHKAWTGTNWWPSQTDWEDIGTKPASHGLYGYPPTAVSWGPGRIDLFRYIRASGEVLHKWTDGNGWGPSQEGWENLGSLNL
jgi:hypothetical protein